MVGPANVVQLTTWYGQKLKGSALLQPDYTFKPLYDRDGAYYTITKFLNQANQKGLVDPDSGTQNWDNACAKMSSGRVDIMWYSWQVGFWNSVDRLNAGTAFRFIPVGDMNFYADADRYYGSDRMFGIGAGVEGEKYDRIMEFLDWYAGPEGVTFQHNGIEGLNQRRQQRHQPVDRFLDLREPPHRRALRPEVLAELQGHDHDRDEEGMVRNVRRRGRR